MTDVMFETNDNTPFDHIRLTNDMTPMKAALFYAELGFFVILLAEGGKMPHRTVAKGWTQNSTRDPNVIRGWYTDFPKANVGISAPPEYVVLDLDVKDKNANGVDAFKGLHEHLIGPSAVTPSGGFHRIFARPKGDDRGNKNLSPRKGGFDYMQDRRRQIVVAPSEVMDPATGEIKRYRWTQGGQPAVMPASVVDKMYELRGRVSEVENDPGDAPDKPQLGQVIDHGFRLDTLDRSHGAFALARDLYIHHATRTNADILATVWDVQAFRDAAMDRRGNEMSALTWLWQYCVWPAEKSRTLWPASDDYDPRSICDRRRIGEAIPLAPWEVEHSDDELSHVSVLRRIRPIDEQAVDYKDPPQFVVKQWFPKGVLTTLFGKDGTGKTLFMQRVCTALAAGEPILGDRPDHKVKCLMVMAEDTPHAIHDRQRRLCSEIGVSLSDVRDTMIIPENLMTTDVKLVSFDRDLKASMTPFYKDLCQYIEHERPEMVVLDPISDIYADEENRREKVSQFMRALNALAFKYNIAVVLIGHPAKAGDSEYSGSGAWSSKSRSRILMAAIRDTPAAPVTLMHRKSSYGKRANDMVLVWTEYGTLRDVSDPVEVQERAAANISTKRGLVEKAILALAETGMTLPDNQGGEHGFSKRISHAGLNGEYDPVELLQEARAMVKEGILEPSFAFDGSRGTGGTKVDTNLPPSKMKKGFWFTKFYWQQMQEPDTDVLGSKNVYTKAATEMPDW